jgi:NAD(P)-dependent dehydrogenase (short-subunit alcohol dehydrogenase family)
MTRLAGRTALVTRASRGIGKAIALRLATEGATVAVHYARNDEAAGQTLREIQQAGGEAFVVRAELGVENDAHTLFTALERGLTGRPLDILVNNAATQSAGPTTPEDFDLMYAVNVKAIGGGSVQVVTDGGQQADELLGRLIGESGCGLGFGLCPGGLDGLHDGFAVFGQPQAGHAAVSGVGGALDEPGPFHPGERLGDDGLFATDSLDEFHLGRSGVVVDVDDEQFLAQVQAEQPHPALQLGPVRLGDLRERVTDRPLAGGDLTPGGHAGTTGRAP